MTASLFIDDTGEMSLETRKVLVQLLTGPSLEAKRHSNLWPILVRDEYRIRSRLHDLFLELILDRDLQIAFTRQAETGDLEVPKLLRRSSLNFIDSVLILFLRQELTRYENQGEKAAVSTDEMLEHLLIYEKNANTDRAGFIKRAQASVEKFKKYNILRKIRNNDGRYEVSPTLKLLFSADEVRELAEVYKNLATGTLSTSLEHEDDSTEGDDE